MREGALQRAREIDREKESRGRESREREGERN